MSYSNRLRSGEIEARSSQKVKGRGLRTLRQSVVRAVAFGASPSEVKAAVREMLRHPVTLQAATLTESDLIDASGRRRVLQFDV